MVEREKRGIVKCYLKQKIKEFVECHERFRKELGISKKISQVELIKESVSFQLCFTHLLSKYSCYNREREWLIFLSKICFSKFDHSSDLSIE